MNDFAVKGVEVLKCCGTKRCKSCPMVKKSNTFKSSYTNNIYPVSSGTLLNCKTKNVIYLITCQKCGYQYVGETECSLRDRMNGHRGTINKNGNTFLAKHFSNHHHKLSSFSV